MTISDHIHDYSEENYTSLTVLTWNLKEHTTFHTNSYHHYQISELNMEHLYRDRNEITGIHEDDRKEVVFFMQNIKNGAAQDVVFARLLTSEGTWRWSRIGAETILDDHGNISKITAVILDMDRILNDRVKLKETSENLDCILNGIPSGINVLEIEADGGFRLKYINSSIYSIFGLTEDEYQKTFHERLLSEMPEDCLLCRFMRGNQKEFLKNGNIETVIRARKLTGEKLWIRVHGQIRKLEEKTFCYISLSDVTDEINSQRREAWQNERYRLLVESHGFISFDYDPDDDILTLYKKSDNGEYKETVLHNAVDRLPSLVAQESLETARSHAERARKEACRGVFESKSIWNDKNRWNKTKYISIADDTGHVYQIVGLLEDIDEEKQKEKHLLDLSKRDSLTGLLNRKAFQEYFDTKAENEEYHSTCGLALIELDHYQEIVREFGYTMGEDILKQAALTMKVCLQNEDFCGRLSDSVFAICFKQGKSPDYLNERLRVLHMALTQCISGLTTTVSIGISFAECETSDFHERFSQADQALRLAEQAGGNQVVVYPDKTESIRITPIQNSAGSGSNRLPQTMNTGIKEKSTEVVTANGHCVRFRTFGYFQIYIDGQPVTFKHVKSQELLALLIDRRGAFVSSQEAIESLWPGEEVNKVTSGRYRKVAMWLNHSLADYDVSDILETKHGARRLNNSKINSDLIDFLTGNTSYQQLFRGAYLKNYKWSESTETFLEILHQSRQVSYPV